jgi:hypothetical protein
MLDMIHNPKWVGKGKSLNFLAFFYKPIYNICSKRKGEGSLKTMSTCLWSHATGKFNIQQIGKLYNNRKDSKVELHERENNHS